MRAAACNGWLRGRSEKGVSSRLGMSDLQDLRRVTELKGLDRHDDGPESRFAGKGSLTASRLQIVNSWLRALFGEME